MNPSRRSVLLSFSAALSGTAGRLPQNKNIKWALSLGLWQHFPTVPFTDVLDVMRDTGFIGLRLTSYPSFLRTYEITPDTIERELKKRGLEVATISFAGPAQDPAQQDKYLKEGRTAMEFLKRFGADRLVCFSPNRRTHASTSSSPRQTATSTQPTPPCAQNSGSTWVHEPTPDSSTSRAHCRSTTCCPPRPRRPRPRPPTQRRAPWPIRLS